MLSLLKQYFGYDAFRPLQEEIINHVVAQNDCFVLMPTGGGKSLCYQLPALKMRGITLVVSPLIALMKDQVDALQSCGVSAAFINSTLSPAQIQDVCAKARSTELKILYIAPERFALYDFQAFLKTLNVSLIAVDEAHCISEWGHNFRPDYRNLSQLKDLFPSVPLIALTATATHKVREDIVNQLQLQSARVFISSFNRENLRVSVTEKKQALPKLLHLLEKYRQESVIIYCFSRNETESIAASLNEHKFNARAYHAGLDAEERSLTQELFIKDQVNIIVATIAFGMGIDKPNVRLVVHFTYPKTLEGYYQEIGRAGRDGLPSECVMFYTYADTRKHEFFINQIEDPELKQRAQDKLNVVSNYARLQTCRKKYLLQYFGEDLRENNCGGCDICVPEKETFVATQSSSKKSKKGELPYNQNLFEKLRTLRRGLASEANVPSFVIFGDNSLQEMAYYFPQDAQAFSRITGVGAQKLERFAAVFVRLISDFVRENNIIPNPLPIFTRAPSTPVRGTKISPSLLRTKQCLQKKMSITETAKMVGYTPSTIIGHIEQLLELQESVDLNYLKLPANTYQYVKAVFQQHGKEKLKPVFEALQGKCSYDYLKLVRALMRTD